MRKSILVSLAICFFWTSVAIGQCNSNWNPATGMITYTCGNVGIGNTLPNYQLHQTPAASGVAHQIDVPIVSGAYEAVRLAGSSNGLWYGGALKGGFNSNGQGFVELQSLHGTNTNTIIYGDPSGNVGIGTTSPGSTTGAILDIYKSSAPFLALSNSGTYSAHIGVNGSNVAEVGSTNLTPFQIITNSAARMFFDTSGNVGIGTTAPAAPLEVRSANTQALFSYSSTQNLFLLHNGAAGYFGTTGEPLILRTGNTDRLTIDTAGNVGIGTVPQAKLDVNGVVKASNRLESRFGGSDTAGTGSSVFFGDASGDFVGIQQSATNDLDFWTINGPWSRRMRLTNAGSLGIGTITPATPLHTYKKDSAASTVTPMLTIEHDSTSQPSGGGFGSAIDFVNRNNSGGGTTTIASLQAYFAVPGNANSGVLDFKTADAGAAPASRMVIDNRGNVGIGTSTPAYTLDVNGSIRATTVIGAVYQDVAEWVPSEEKLEAATVVVLRPGHSNEVTASREAYDTKVAGVVSAQPGVLLGQAGDGKSMIATTGRVRVLVDATSHPIAVGDLLVTSATPGAAMYSQAIEIAGVKLHRPGTIIGKALEPLESGTGEILVLLSLQ